MRKDRPIYISKGYSRDHRPDLKQCVLDLITTQDGEMPLFIRVGDGNESDKAVFGKIAVQFKKQIDFGSILVSDSALYSQENLKVVKEMKWITRVPLTLKKAKELVQTVEVEENEKEINGYKWKEEIVKYAGITQRWIVFESEQRRESGVKKLEKMIEKEKVKVKKIIKKLQKEEFETPTQGRKNIKDENKKLKLFEIEETQLNLEKIKDDYIIYKLEIREKLKKWRKDKNKREDLS